MRRRNGSRGDKKFVVQVCMGEELRDQLRALALIENVSTSLYLYEVLVRHVREKQNVVQCEQDNGSGPSGEGR